MTPEHNKLRTALRNHLLLTSITAEKRAEVETAIADLEAQYPDARSKQRLTYRPRCSLHQRAQLLLPGV